ncbi:DMT family transporter, partial [Burkholderia multivorans]
PLFVVGVANSALPFCLLTYAALFVTAGTDSILNATTPLWTALVAYVWLRTPLTKPQTLGLAVGFAGVVVLAGSAVGAGAAGTPGAIAAAMLA